MSREVERDAGGSWPESDDDLAADHYRSLLSALDHGVFRVDAGARFEAVDEDFAGLVGRPAERLEGAHVATVLVEGEAERFERALESGSDGSEDATLELSVQPADGDPVAATIRLEPIADEGGLEGAVGVVEPVDGGRGDRPNEIGGEAGSDREEVSAAAAPEADGVSESAEGDRESDRYRALTEAARDVVVTIDEDSVVESINPAVEDLFGYEPSELVGESLTVLMPEELEHRYQEALDRYLRTGDRRIDWDYVELEGVDASGERIPLAISFGEVVHEGESHFTGIIRDITERQTYQRELRQYEKLVEESTDVISIVDPDGTIDYATPSARRVMGYGAGELVGEDAFELIHPEDRAEARAEFEALIRDPDYRAQETFRLRRSDGSWVVVQARARNLTADPHVGGIVVYTHDITERRRNEKRLEEQRERLAALNQLNEVVRGVTEAVIDRSTRAEIEAITCERLAASDSYEFAWIGELDPRAGGLTTRAEAGVEDYLEAIADRAGDDGQVAPMEAAIRQGEAQVVRDVTDDPEFEAWREAAEEHGFRSFASVPIGHEDTIYGVIAVFADRVDAFQNEERTVVEHLGEIVGHAIAATERKQALMSDSVLELEIEIGDLFAAVDGDGLADATVRIDQVLSVADDEFLVYGVADEAAIEALESLREVIPHWGAVTVLSEAAEGYRFEVGLSEPPAISAVASLGGSVRSARIDDGDYRLTVQFPQGTDARQVLETVRDHFPDAEVLARRQVTRSEAASERFTRAWLERLTDRQRTALEVAYYAGFFEWPRDSSGEDVAESIDVSAPTFHQHVRTAERKLFAALLEEADPGGSDGEPGSMLGSEE